MFGKPPAVRTSGTPPPNTFLGLPVEVRLAIYQHLIGVSTITVCGYRFRRGHLIRETLSKGRHICTRKCPMYITHICGQVRREAFPLLMSLTLLQCCHLGQRLVDSKVPALYRQSIRGLCIEASCYSGMFVQSFRLDVPHRRCTTLPKLPQLERVVVGIQACMSLPYKYPHDKVSCDEPYANGLSLREEAVRRARMQLQRQSSASPPLSEILNDKQRGFGVDVLTHFADFSGGPDEERGVSVFMIFDYDTDELKVWVPGSAQHASEFRKLKISHAWYRRRSNWRWLSKVLPTVN